MAPGFFDLLIGEKVAFGRHFVAEDGVPGNDHVVILNNKFWKERFGSDRPLRDILMVQDDLAREVTKALRASIEDGVEQEKAK